MENHAKKWKRQRWIITPGFQWPIVIKTVIIAAIAATFFTWSTFYFFWTSLLHSGHPSLIPLLYQPALWVGWSVCLLLCLTLSALIMIRVTHRVAGQMYRFESELDHIIEGQNPRAVHTRKDDYFHDFEAVLNGCIAKGGSR
ncbi:MAG: hypothetical protein NTW14_04805 [bacterium]|nr:hypothetical protein [bacterium]